MYHSLLKRAKSSPLQKALALLQKAVQSTIEPRVRSSKHRSRVVESVRNRIAQDQRAKWRCTISTARKRLKSGFAQRVDGGSVIKMKIDFNQIISVMLLGLLSWGGVQLYQMNANVSVIAYKVDQNYDMIKPMWRDFLVRQAQYDKSWTNTISSIPTSGEEE